MKFAGIIAEYDPFHNGHAWQLQAARERGARAVAVALSCALTQRGAPPLLPERVRAAAALDAGASLVFALPAPWAMSGAEAFARAGVALIKNTIRFMMTEYLKCRTAISGQIFRSDRLISATVRYFAADLYAIGKFFLMPQNYCLI